MEHCKAGQLTYQVRLGRCLIVMEVGMCPFRIVRCGISIRMISPLSCGVNFNSVGGWQTFVADDDGGGNNPKWFFSIGLWRCRAGKFREEQLRPDNRATSIFASQIAVVLHRNHTRRFDLDVLCKRGVNWDGYRF